MTLTLTLLRKRQSSKGKVRIPSSGPFRELPHFTDPCGPPSSPAFVSLYHPVALLELPAYDLLSKSPLEFGIHHETLVTAGHVLAYNKAGFLSTSRDRGAPHVKADLDSVILVAKYYFHLETPRTRPLYPICRDLKLWELPHDQLG